MNEPTDWTTAIVILGAGLILGVLFVVFFNRRKSAKSIIGGEADLEMNDLYAKRDALLQSLRDLDQNVTPSERTRLELETADVLRQIDARGSAIDTESDERTVAPASSMSPALRGFLWGAGSFLALAGLGYFVMQSTTEREEGGSPTGGMLSQRPAGEQSDPMLERLQAAVNQNPDDLRLRNDLAQAYLERDNLMAVFEHTKFVLDRSPEDSRSLTYQGLVRLAMGEGELAQNMLQRATASDPKNLDSWVALAWVYAQSERMGEAEKMIAEAAKQSPQDKERLEEVFEQMKMQVAQMAAQPAGAMGGELPQGHPPIAGDLPAGHPPVPDGTAAMPAAPAATGARPAPPVDGKSVRITLDLDAAAKSKTGVLFVMARPAAGGPPVAVKRMQVASFPVTFDFGSADSMMGQPLPERFLLEARLDSDGDAATKSPSDPTAMQRDVAPGSILQLSLK
ncbi:MAG TPA: tetratricopeptide repeat protein [Thermoanaerobaculia bacterium]